MRRHRNAKIVATLGPSSSDAATIRALFDAGADVFRLNFSHGTQDQHRERLDIIRTIERETARPIAVLLDLQGPKLRVGTFAGSPVRLEANAAFRLDMDAAPGDATRASLPHPEIFAALTPGIELLLDDGKIRLVVERCGPAFAETRVTAGGLLSDRKGVNVPGVVLPIAILTPKDKSDLEFGLSLGVDWVALSFVQRAQDLDEARALIGGRAAIMSKLEKPAAIEHLDAIVERSDGIMVARGDLGVELPAERVPVIQRRIVRACRKAGRPVIVATQMLESMVAAPVPTRAEASDVATAVYEGADAVMLSAESASGRYPVEAVRMMDRIIEQVESDPQYREMIDASHTPAEATVSDAIFCATHRVAELLHVAVTVTYTSSGHSSLRAARERPTSPILSLTPNVRTARRLALVWGVHSVETADVKDVDGMVDTACRRAVDEGFASSGDTIVIAAGMPFGVAGTTNLLRIARA
ncbi:MAG TPA: pyruvate kinase [Casimicrobiaceae bacterium]|jgi:pyruvate kinase|nr:pyruvate kinase [Casimicrobiaceae bacterium]